MFHSVQVGTVVPDVSDGEEITEKNEELVKLQHQDKELRPVVSFLEQGLLPPEEKIARQLILEKCRYVVLDKVLYQIDDLRKNRFVFVCTSVYETRTHGFCQKSHTRSLFC